MNETQTRRTGSRWSRSLITLVGLALAGALIWHQLPHGGYASDLSRIGKGRPALLLAFDNNHTAGRDAMELMNSIRANYADRMEFLVTNLGTLEGRTFAQRHNAVDGTVLLFAGDGSLVKTVDQPQTADELRGALREAFAL
jgi:hypothetical protein